MILLGLGMMLVCFKYFSLIEVITMMLMMVLFNFVVVDWTTSWLYIGNFLSIDLMGFMLIELSLWIGMLMYLASFNVSIFSEGLFSFYIMLMMLLLMVCFSISNLIGFYLFFESVLFPIIMLIMGWGSQPERLQAGLYMLFYTVGGSLPLLVFLLFNMESLSFIYNYWMEGKESYIWLVAGVVGFFIKMPMFIVHVWLPKAHVEAPVAGSMVLAGVLLKLGVYGLFRVKSLIEGVMISSSYWVVSVILVGGLIVSMICFCQVDLKALIAYSSVCHMGLSLGGIFSGCGWGCYGNMMMVLGHGLCSSGLFCLANFYYERFFTRSMLLLKGVGCMFPFLMVWWFLFSVSNMAAPPTMNLGGEVFLMGSLMKWSLMVLLPLGLISFFSAVYSLYMFSYLHHGVGWFNYGVYSVSTRELLLMCLHLTPLVYWVLKMEIFSQWI
uniref:NADH dehydrogenase subunit 4 n=1 Tax=Ornithodoros tartakovskyi TaxID=570969 RepID=UPI0022377633|nr:NADH dehydrogenase subunit 4 [Ornithodoros tartakovskyi]UYB78673.1 NADH dehydrogenase subunit 4 [Ornithodoros tartakovskyi]UYB78686.1 NADH dehydrogenase subunit 4 [Ornithodoros tartakovskyi]